ncbi:MAG: AMP-binding protein [Myxococcota bacterium]
MSLSVPQPLLSAAATAPGRLAVEAEDGSASFAALAEATLARAGWLDAHGVGPGARVALVAEPSLAFVEAFFAVMATGALVAPLDPQAGDQERRDTLLRLSPTHTYLPKDIGRAAPLPERFLDLEAPLLALSTSGSSGAPRVITLQVSQVLFSAMGSALRLGHHLDDRWLLCLPLHHVGGLSILIRAAWGATSVQMLPRFSARQAAARLDSGTISLVSVVPAMLDAILKARVEAPFPRALRAILLGGDRAPPELLRRAASIQAPVWLTWGMTETSSQVATGPALPGASAVGAPLAFARVEAGGDGALSVRGPLAAGGQFLTADRGAVTPEGLVIVEGRRDLAFITGGENVDPARVESALTAHPDVASALVLPLPDPHLGSVPAAVLVPRGDKRPSPEELSIALAPSIPRHEHPRRVAWVEALPRSSAGKPSRDSARRLFFQEESR